MEVFEMRLSLIAGVLLLGGMIAPSVEAMPLVAEPAVAQKAPAAIQVDYACGRGWHLNRWGECRRNEWRGPPPGYWGHRPPPPPPDDWRSDYRPRYWHRPPPGWY
ncbi:hypothetical protein DTW90_06430 [Neorhizobium sp. P12A]|nr:hypothetical protein DTW90_06430 [Neorhizobium sp. P12A]